MGASQIKSLTSLFEFGGSSPSLFLVFLQELGFDRLVHAELKAMIAGIVI